MNNLPKKYSEFEAGVAELFDTDVRGLSWVLKDSWVTGGMSGGNCYGDSANYSVEADPEPEHDTLDSILEAFVPELSFLHYRKLLKSDIYDVASDNHDEYYGNYTTGKMRTLDLAKLYAMLQEFSA